MARKKIPTKTIRIHQRPDGRHETRNETPTDSTLGVDASLNQALGTAHREATLASLDGYQVKIEVQVKGNKFKQVDVILPPNLG